MAGFWNLSYQQLHDGNGRPYPAARANFYAADSLTPLTVYQDYGLGTPHANPVVADAFGVFPPVFFDEADNFYRQRITTSGGVTIGRTDLTVLPIIGPAGTGAAVVPVDTNAILQTGDLIWTPKSGTRSGFVRANGRTIGSATSGGSERANSDCELLFLDYWNTYSNTIAAVSGGRGISGAADWAANKTITLLDMRNKGPFGLDDMGNSAAGGFTGITFSRGDATTAASLAGAARKTLDLTEIPGHDHGGSTGSTAANLLLSGVAETTQIAASNNTTLDGGSTKIQLTSQGGASSVTNRPHVHTIASAGGGSPFDKLPPLMLGTWYQKL